MAMSAGKKIQQANVCLWVKPEPFDVGIIPHPLPSKLTHHNLRKLFAYAKNKGKSGYPRLSYSVWKHVACNKLLIEESLAWIYFHTCEILTEKNQENHMKNAEAFIGQDEKAADKIKEQRDVDLLKFILYLFIQRAHVISLKSPAVTGDEFPSRNRSQDLEGRAAIGTKGIDENTQMSFMMTNMANILDLLVEPDTYGTDSSDVQLSLKAINKLSFLIGATFDGRTTMDLDVAASLQQESQKAGYSKISEMFSARRLQSWIKAYLHKNPFGVCSCLSIGQKLRGRGYSCGDDSFNSSLNLSMTDEERQPTYRHSMEWTDVQEQLSKDLLNLSISVKSSQQNMVNRILSNSNYAPECCKRIICNQVCRRTVARTGDVLCNSTVNVHRCQNAHLYLLSPLRSVVIEKCHDTTVVLGCVDTVLVVVACEKVKVVAPCKRIIIVSCRDSSFHLCTSSPPVFVGRNQNIRLAPYYTYYPSLTDDMNSCGVVPEPNFWNKPTILGNKKQDSPVWMEYPPSEFFKFVIPFDFEGCSKTCPVHLPQAYKDALIEREQYVITGWRIEEWHQMIRESGLKKTQRVQLQSMVNEKFQEWLRESGNNTLLESLAPPVPPAIPR